MVDRSNCRSVLVALAFVAALFVAGSAGPAAAKGTLEFEVDRGAAGTVVVRLDRVRGELWRPAAGSPSPRGPGYRARASRVGTVGRTGQPFRQPEGEWTVYPDDRLARTGAGTWVRLSPPVATAFTDALRDQPRRPHAGAVILWFGGAVVVVGLAALARFRPGRRG